MNYTQNHHLPQWVKSDRIRMDDFNDAMASIESGMSANAQAAASAQATADRALSNSGGSLHFYYSTGSYPGTGADRFVELGFEPTFVIVSNAQPSGERDVGMFCLSFSGGIGVIMDRGFKVLAPDSAHPEYPNLTRPQTVYTYIAFA